MDPPKSLPQGTIDFAYKMFNAAREGDVDLLSAALDAGLPPDLTNAQGNTLLMLAAYAGQTQVVQALIDKGANVDKMNDKGQSPIAGAVFKGYDDIVKALMQAGADPRAGQPNAIQSARMFKRDALLDVLGTQEGEGMDIPAMVGPPV